MIGTRVSPVGQAFRNAVRRLVGRAGIAAAVLGGLDTGGSGCGCRGAWGTAAAAEPRAGLATGPWKLEAIRFHDGRRLEGLVTDPGPPLGFVQIVQPPGRPVELITWPPLGAARIAAIEPLPPADHAVLARRVEEFRTRRGRQHAAETAVTLRREGDDDPWRYEGRWFAVESTADPSLTRRAVVLLEQVFEALDALVPAAHARAAGPPLRVVLCGTAAEYRGLQERLGIRETVGDRAEHPALYVPARDLLVAGSDMPALVERERAAADRLELAEREIADRDRGFAADVRRLAGDLERQGVPAGRRAEIVQLARHRWQREREGLLAQVVSARRDNAARVADAAREFAARLTHEAWHAHADRRLAEPGGHPLPPWLDEGLAQVFETAPLEAGELRLDAPDAFRLKALQELIAGGHAPRLEDLLRADAARFLVGHAGGRQASRDAYLMAWGLAFHMAVLEPVLTPGSLAAVCAKTTGDAPSDDRVAEFEQLAGLPLAEFEPAWRRRMLALRPVSQPPAP